MIKQQLLTVLFVTAITVTFLSGQYASALSFVEVPLTGTLNVNDFPYGIECSDDTYVYMTIFSQGALARINKSTLATEVIQDNELNASGEDFYSISRNPSNGDLLINKADKGEFVIYHTSSNTWEKHPLIEEVVHASVSYPSTYQGQPNLIKVNEPVHGDHTYEFGLDSRGESKFTNGNFWVLLDDVRDFDDNANGIGVNDISFHGIVKIDPTTFSVSRISIPATTVNGLAIDSVDSTILWIASNSDDKLFKFDTNTNSVIETISLPVGTKARGLITDSSFVYIAMNKAGGVGENSKILKVTKSNTLTQVELDTTASNTVSGTFALLRVGNYLGWSDESGHVGLINLQNNQKQVFNTTDITSNRFACTPDNGQTVWFAGKGSVKSTIVSVSDSSSVSDERKSNGDGNKYLSRPTIGKSHLTGEQLVDFGFFHNVDKYTITDNFYTPSEKIPIVTGESNNFGLKTFVGDAFVKVGEISLVPEVGAFGKAEVRLEAHFNFDKTLKDVKVVQKDNIIDSKLVTAYQRTVDCFEDSGRDDCVFIGFENVIFKEKPIFEKIAINVINDDRQANITYLNDGFSFTGIDSFNPPVLIDAVVEKGELQTLERIDKKSNLWISESGIIYWKNDFGTFIRQTPYSLPECTDNPSNVMTRNHCSFNDLISYEAKRAMGVFDSIEFQKSDKGYKASPESGIDKRTQTLRLLGWLD